MYEEILAYQLYSRKSNQLKVADAWKVLLDNIFDIKDYLRNLIICWYR